MRLLQKEVLDKTVRNIIWKKSSSVFISTCLLRRRGRHDSLTLILLMSYRGCSHLRLSFPPAGCSRFSLWKQTNPSLDNVFYQITAGTENKPTFRSDETHLQWWCLDTLRDKDSAASPSGRRWRSAHSQRRCEDWWRGSRFLPCAQDCETTRTSAERNSSSQICRGLHRKSSFYRNQTSFWKTLHDDVKK